MAPATALRLAGAVALAGLGVAAAGCGGEKASVTTVRAPTTVVVTTTTTSTTTESGPTAGSSLADVVSRALPSVVNVRTTTFGGEKAEGSGVVIDAKGVLVTNFHVVRDAQTLTIAFNDGRHGTPMSAEVIGTAAERDLAVLRVRATDLTPMPLGDSSKLRLGDGVVALGYPLDLGGPTVTSGIVSGLNRTITPGQGPALEGLLQTDAAINPGNSGGALVDLAGRLVGIPSAAASAGFAENVGFAISIDEAKPVIQEIRNKPPDKRAWLGVSVGSVDSPAAAAQLGLDPSVRGAAVLSVVPTGPSAKAGVKEGDVIVSVDGKEIRSSKDLTKVLGGYDPGERVTLELVDPQGPRRVTLKLAKRPATID